MADDDSVQFHAELINDYSEAFDKLCQERHDKGQAVYGVFTFLGNDVIRMMMEEVADTANYCRYQFIKLMFLQHMLEQDPQLQTDEDNNIAIGLKAFKGTKEGWRKNL